LIGILVCRRGGSGRDEGPRVDSVKLDLESVCRSTVHKTLEEPSFWMLLDERDTGALGAEEFTNILLDPK
jgi:hypothetical protein